MKLVRTVEMKPASFNLYFLGYKTSDKAHAEGLLELTWNYGTEKDAGFKYHNGNTEPQGFGHICVSVDDLEAACDRFEMNGVSIDDP
jgi:lactoylglutathione lyase